MAGASYDRYNAYVALPQIEADVKEVKKTVSESSTSCPFPVGSVLLFNDATDPNTTWSGTTWEQIAGDRYLVGAGSSHEVGGTGGSNTKTIAVENLPSHTHSGASHAHSFSGSANGTTGSDGAHTHTYTDYHAWTKEGGSGSAKYVGNQTQQLTTDSDGSHTHSFSVSISGTTGDGGSGDTGSTGSGTALNIEPSYYTVCIWERTA